ncbi:hypothetical protein TNCV_2114131 [Trichonephila clavipes]|nr:hypothetical protein TNCV_2114131 [Trichonephila clavipes]
MGKLEVDVKLLDVHASSKKKDVGENPLSIAKMTGDTESSDSPIRCRSKCKCFGTHNAAGSVGRGTDQQLSHSGTFVYKAFL